MFKHFKTCWNLLQRIQNPFKSKKFASIIITSHKAKNYNLVKTINILGKHVDRVGEKTLLIYLYDDGSVEKKYEIR